MKTLTQKFQELEKDIKIKVEKKLRTRGVKSEFRSEKVLKVKRDEDMFNLEGGRYLAELTENELIDSNGYAYNFCCLEIEKLCQVVDNI